MFNRRGFVSGAAFATIATIDLASSPGRADSQDPSEYPLKILNKTEYPGDKYACILVDWTSLQDNSSRGICTRALNPPISPWAASRFL